MVLAVCLAACGGDDDDDGPPSGPYDELPLDKDLQFEGIQGAVHIVRDEFGVMHIHAENVPDLYFATGYVMAHDRLPQMDILRRFGSGTVAELFGIEDDAYESDLEMRVHRFRSLSQQALMELRASDDPVDAELVAGLEAFARGVNAYNEDVKAGLWELDPRILAVFDPERFAPWEPVDSLVLGKFQAFALSYTADFVLDATDVYQTARATFAGADAGTDPDLAARAGAAQDLLRIAPIDTIPTVDGLPNLVEDTGSRSNAISTSARRLEPDSATARLLRKTLAEADPALMRPRVPRELLRNGSRTHRPTKRFGPDGLFVPRSGSNNWVVGPQHAGGKALLAGDPHLSLPNPSIFYPLHLVIPGELDVEGGTFPGIPGVLHGHNGNVAWASTVVFHDVNDVYLEEIIDCTGGPGQCVLFDGEEVIIETWEETFNAGSLGTVFDTQTFTYERVPHHGHFIPTVEDRAVVPRSSNQALSVRYTGHQITHEIRFLWHLNRAQNLGDAFASLSHFKYGGQNWVFIDKSGDIGWSTHADVPLRDPNALTYHPSDNPDGNGPFFVLPGKGSAEWTGFMDPRYIPHAVNPAKGYLVTANSDPIGATFDGNPTNVDTADGVPLFLSAFYAPGSRTARIDDRLQELISNGTTITLDDMADIQADSYSNLGDQFAPLIVTAAGAIDDGTRADVNAWLATLDPPRIQRLRTAIGYLEDWTYQTPPAVEGSPSQAEIDASVATTIFNAWGHYFLGNALGDELQAIDWDIYDLNQNLTIRVALALLREPDSFMSGLHVTTGQPILCDRLGTGEIESCTLIALQSLDMALDWISGPEGLDTDAMTDWRWGLLHTLTLEPLFPNNELNIPPPNDPNPVLRNGYPRAGDNFAVNRADCTWDDREFEQDGAGPAQRMLAEAADGSTRIRIAYPGGAVYDPSSPHFRDLMDNYYIPNTHFDFPFATGEIVSHGEERWVIRSK